MSRKLCQARFSAPTVHANDLNMQDAFPVKPHFCAALRLPLPPRAFRGLSGQWVHTTAGVNIARAVNGAFCVHVARMAGRGHMHGLDWHGGCI